MTNNQFTLPVCQGILAKSDNCLALSYFSGGGAINIYSKRKKDLLSGKFFNLPFIRGVAYFIMIYVRFFYYLALSLKLSSHYAKPQDDGFDKIAKKLEINSWAVVWTVCGVITIAITFLGLSFLPAIIVRMLPVSYGQVVMNLILASFKILLFYILALSLKMFYPIRAFYRLNSAACKAARCMQNGDREGKDIENQKSFYPTNFLSYSFFCFLLTFFVISLYIELVNPYLMILLNIAVFVLCLSVTFEAVSLIGNKNYFIFNIINLIFAFPFMEKCKKTEEELALCALKELNLMNMIKKREDMQNSGDMVAASAVLTEIKKVLSAAGINDESEAEWLLATVLEVNRAELRLRTTITKEEQARAREVAARRANHEPLSKIFGFAEFYGERFKVDRNVLSPRMETEEVVEKAIKIIKANDFKTCLDLCTGSGCIAITIKKNTNTKVTAVDISKKALEVAMENAKNLGADIEFVCSDMLAGLKNRKKFDIIVSNPPYLESEELLTLSKEVASFDPTIALDGGEDGLSFYRKIAQDAPKHLNRGGALVLEISEYKANEVKNLLSQKFEAIKVFSDNFGKSRIITAYLKG